MPESKSLTSLDRRQRILLAAVCGLEFAESLVLTIVIPLLPITAKEKGVSNFEVGILFGVAWLAAALSGVVHGKLLSRITPISLAIAGCVITAIGTVGIGLAGQFSRDLVEFLPSVIVLRILQGCGYSAIAVSAQAILSAEMPEHKLGVQAAYQGSVALGFTLSPPIAGGLYAANGFWLPFIVMSVILLIILIIVAIPLRHLKGQVVQHKSGQYFPLLLQPRAILTVAHSLVIAFVFRFFEGFIPVHMHEQFGWGPAEVAWLFTVCAVVFIIFLPIWVKLNTALMGNVAVMSWCMLMAGISFFLLAPAPFIPVKYPWWASSLVCLFYAISYAGAIVTNVPDLNFVASKTGYPDDYGTYGIVSASVNGALTIGFFSGPLIGGALMDHIGFSWTTVVFGLLQFLFGLFLITRLLVDKFLGHKDGVVARGLSRRLPQAEDDSAAGPSEMEYLEHGDHVEQDTGKCSGEGIENKAFVGSSGVETPISREPGKLTNDGQESTSCDILESRVESESLSSAVSKPTINNADIQSTPPVEQTEDDTKTN